MKCEKCGSEMRGLNKGEFVQTPQGGATGIVARSVKAGMRWVPVILLNTLNRGGEELWDRRWCVPIHGYIYIDRRTS